jgi:hypothetical protein
MNNTTKSLSLQNLHRPQIKNGGYFTAEPSQTTDPQWNIHHCFLDYYLGYHQIALKVSNQD